MTGLCASDRLVLIVLSGYALAGRERVAFAEALGGDFVGLSGDSSILPNTQRAQADACGCGHECAGWMPPAAWWR